MTQDDANPFTRFEYEGWQRVARLYPEAWGGLTRLFIPALLQELRVGPGDRLLDVACGPGYVSEAAQALGAETVGVDFSPEMIRLARERNPGLDFRLGDAMGLEVEDESFDRVAMNFGLLHLAEPAKALAEAARVLRPGGRLGFTLWAGPETSPGARLVGEVLQAHAEPVSDLPQGPDYYLYTDPEELRRVLARAGFDPRSLALREVTEEWSVPEASFLFWAEREAGVRTAALLARQSTETLAAIEAAMAAAVRRFASSDGFAIPYTAYVVTAAVWA